MKSHTTGMRSAILVLLVGLLRAQPDSAEANYSLGLTHLRAGRTDAAARALGKACELAPRHEDACYQFARALHFAGQYESARAPFEQALRAAPKQKLPAVHRAVALNFYALGMAEDAERHFVKAVSLHAGAQSGADDPRIDYGAFLFRQGRTAEALVPLEQAARAAPSSPRANAELGRVLLHVGKLEAAAAVLAKAVALDPRNWNSHLLLGNAYLRLGKTAEGEREIRLGQEGWASKK